MIMGIKYKAYYDTHDPYIAADLYKKRTGFDPVVIVIRPDFAPTRDHPLLVEDRHCPFGLILVTHFTSSNQ